MSAARGFRIELEREEDGRFLADWMGLPGAAAYGATEDEAIRRVLSRMPSTPSPEASGTDAVGLVVLDLDGGEIGPRLLDRMARRIPPARRL